MEPDRCIICGVETDLYYAANKNIPLCQLPSCEVALENEINGVIQEVVNEEVDLEVV